MNKRPGGSAHPSTPAALPDLPLIRASELAQYSFCHRAWWLGVVKGVSSSHQTALTRGTKVHYRHEQQVRMVLRWQQASFFLLGSGGLLLIVTALAWLWLNFFL